MTARQATAGGRCGRRRAAEASTPQRAEAEALLAGRDSASTPSSSSSALFFLIPLYVMVVTSLKGMPEIRLGNIFSPPVEITFQPWVKAWLHACTGRNCDGLSPRLLELGQDHRAERASSRSSSPRSTATRSPSGASRAPTSSSRILIFGAFIPYQVMLYPLDHRCPRRSAVYGTLAGIIIVHTIFGMPILTLLFRNFFAVAAGGTVQGGARRRRRLLGASSSSIMLPMSLPIFVVAIILQVTGIWNDFLFGVVFAGRRHLADDGAAQQHRQLDDRACRNTTSTWRRRS